MEWERGDIIPSITDSTLNFDLEVLSLQKDHRCGSGKEHEALQVFENPATQNNPQKEHTSS